MKVRIPSPATIVSIVALVFATAGTATAAALITGSQIKDNTVGSVDLKNNGVRSLDVQDNTLTSSDIKDGALRTVDFAAGELTTGPAGPSGPAGPAGAAGTPGAPGLAALEIVSGESATNSVTKQFDISCPAGKKLIGGGGQVFNAGGFAALDESYPVNDTTWRVTAYEINPTAVNWKVIGYASCATVAA